MAEALENERAKAIHSAKLASLGEISAGIAHEINNPLTIIKVASKILSHNVEHNPKLDEKLLQIDKAVERIRKIVGGLKRLARINQGKDKISISLNTLLDDSIDFIKIKPIQMEIPLEIKSLSKAMFNCNPVEIEQVIINLINNAADAVKDLPEKWIQLETYDICNYVVIRVTDSGTGIPSAIAGKLFDPFFTTKAVGDGTGLGLSITRSIILEHGGEIEVDESYPNTRFLIRLPVLSCQSVGLGAGQFNNKL